MSKRKKPTFKATKRELQECSVLLITAYVNLWSAILQVIAVLVGQIH